MACLYGASTVFHLRGFEGQPEPRARKRPSESDKPLGFYFRFYFYHYRAIARSSGGGAGRMKRGYKRRKCAPLVDYRAFGAGVLIQSGGKRLRARCPQPLVEVPDIQFDLFFEIIHPMCAGYT